MTTFAVGDRIIIDPSFAPVRLRGIVFEVEKVNPKNIIAKPVGGGRGINYPKHALLPAPADLPADAQQVATAIPYEPPVFHDTGAIVTCDQPLGEWAAGTPLIVWKSDGHKSNVVTLGGSPRGRYYRVVASRLTVRDTAWLAQYLNRAGA